MFCTLPSSFLLLSTIIIIFTTTNFTSGQQSAADDLQPPDNSSSAAPEKPSTTPPASVSVECKEPLPGSASWECAIGHEAMMASANHSSEEDGAWELLMMGTGGGGKMNSSSGDEEEDEQARIHAGPLELYHSHKVNRTDGRLFISATLRWEFHSSQLHSAYRVRLRVTELNKQQQTHVFTIPLVPVRNESSSLASGSSSRTQKAELFIRLDGLFQFGHSYQLKIFSQPFIAADEATEITKSRATINRIVSAEKSVHFDELFDEFDTDGCPNEDGQQHRRNGGSSSRSTSSDSSALLRRRAMASRWTGALRSVTFFPLHSAINVTFFGAPPSLCIPGYRLKLWLLNALQQEHFVPATQLVREGPGVFVGSAEFRDLLAGDQRLKYRVSLVPEERLGSGGTCVCQLERKCGCVQVYSDPFAMPKNASAIAASLDPFAAVHLLPVDATAKGNNNEGGGQSLVLPAVLACLFLALTLVLLSFAILLLMTRRSGGFGVTKRRTLLHIRSANKEEDRGLVVGCKDDGQPPTSADGLLRREVQSVLLVNAQPARRGELERFARLLVKNGVRVFYDRWDRAALERNLLQWVHQATTRADKAVLFYDRRAEQLAKSADVVSSMDNEQKEEDLFDRVFCALQQRLDPKKTIFVKWDEGTPSESRPLGCIGDSVFLFHRDLKLIYSSLQVPISEAELRELQQKYARPDPLVIVVPKQPAASPLLPRQAHLAQHHQQLLTNVPDSCASSEMPLLMKEEEEKEEIGQQAMPNNEPVENGKIRRKEEEKEEEALNVNVANLAKMPPKGAEHIVESDSGIQSGIFTSL